MVAERNAEVAATDHVCIGNGGLVKAGHSEGPNKCLDSRIRVKVGREVLVRSVFDFELVAKRKKRPGQWYIGELGI